MSAETEKIYALLNDIPDPEIPVISITDLGIVRDVRFEDEQLVIDITPTYSGCPAMKQIEKDIEWALKKNGFKTFKINTVYSPAWTTDWIGSEAKERLRKYGIAPPEHSSENKGLLMLRGKKPVACPLCGSTKTQMISQFGSTACKALYKCNDCLEPFDYFKCL